MTSRWFMLLPRRTAADTHIPQTVRILTHSSTHNTHSIPPHSISHDIADGGSIAGFLLAWALASNGQPFPPAAHDRAVLREVPAEEKKRIEAMPVPEGLLRMNLWKVRRRIYTWLCLVLVDG